MNVLRHIPEQKSVRAIAADLLTVFVLYFVCRAVFIFENFASFGEGLTPGALPMLLRGGLLFDTSAIAYTNALWVLLVLLPLHCKERRWWRTLTKWVYVTVNTLCLAANFADTVFFGYRGQRSTTAIFSEFGGEDNLAKIVGLEMLSHWYLVVLLAVMIWVLARLYRHPEADTSSLGRYYAGRTLWLAVFAILISSGMRGSIVFDSSTRPISPNFAFRYTTTPAHTGIVLNTPFTFIRTLGQSTTPAPRFFASAEELDAVYSPLHTPKEGAEVRRKNVVILILESFSREFVGALNPDLDGGTYKGFTPFFDEMLGRSLWFDEMIANTFFSIDAPPAVLAAIPRAEYPFVVSQHSVNTINSIAGELKTCGYATAFFHGADNESLGIGAFTRQAGFDRYYGLSEFVADPRFGGRDEYDGTWGIWDEPFLQYFCTTLGELPEPFVAGVFTLSSHHPFRIPDKYRDVFPEEGEFELYKCVRYSDYALRRFFEEAEKQPWFDNTIFVLSSDHTSSKRTHAEYKNEMGNMRIPILFYDPSGEMPRGRHQGIAQQTDIMPTLLGWLGYDKPYIAFGKDLLSTAPEDTWAFNWNSIPIYLKGDYLMIFDGEHATGLYNYRNDPQHRHNLLGSGLPEEADMELHVKAVVQSYLERMNGNALTAR